LVLFPNHKLWFLPRKEGIFSICLNSAFFSLYLYFPVCIYYINCQEKPGITQIFSFRYIFQPNFIDHYTAVLFHHIIKCRNNFTQVICHPSSNTPKLFFKWQCKCPQTHIFP
jgi:hypothetical protein